MNNELPQKYNENIFTKIKKYFKSLFSKNDNESNKMTTKNEPTQKNNNVNKVFIKELKNDAQDSIDKYNMYKIAMDNPDIINDWDFNKLNELNQICDEKISQLKNQILRYN